MSRSRKCNSLQLSGSFLFSSNYARPVQQQQQHQYRATQMWHKSLETFLASVPLSQHRSKVRFWRVFDSTFTGAEAVTWFHGRLKESFDQEISKEQTKKLLGKFYRAGVFYNAEIEPNADQSLDEADFKDSQMHIYRLAMERPGPVAKTPSPAGKMAAAGKMKKNYSVEIKPLTLAQIENLYFELMVEWLKPLTSTTLSALQPTANVYNNILSVSQPVSNCIKSCLFPSWVMPAMHYLAHYPEDSHRHIDYPNFESDVSGLIFDYFVSFFERSGELITDSELFIDALNNIQPALPHSKYQEKFPFPKSEFEEIDKIFTPESKNVRRFVMGKNRNRRLIFDDSATSLSDEVSVKPMGLVDTSRYHSNVYLATAFDVQSPVTKVLSQNEVFAYDNHCLSLSPADLINHPKYGGLRGRLNGGRKSLSVGDLVDSSDDDGGFAPIEPNLPETKRPTIEALTLLLLTLDPGKRKHLEILLKYMGKVEKNLKLSLHVGISNKELLFFQFSRLITNKFFESHGRDLIAFMIANVDNLFGGEYLDGFKKRAEDSVSERQIQKVPITSTGLNTKENLSASYCSKISMIEYEDQRLLGETSKSLRNLLDEMSLLQDEKLKKKQLKKFQKEYPHIYAEKFNNASSTLEENSPFQQQKSKKRTPFGVLI